MLAAAHGVSDLAGKLRRLGGTRANEANVRYWLSAGSLRPDDPSDFLAILTASGYATEFETALEAMDTLGRAHRKAGHHIRALLLAQIASRDPEQLSYTDRIDFDLPAAEGGTLTAFRVSGRDPEPLLVPVNRIGHPFVVGELM
jgi:hypothetical protein